MNLDFETHSYEWIWVKRKRNDRGLSVAVKIETIFCQVSNDYLFLLNGYLKIYSIIHLHILDDFLATMKTRLHVLKDNQEADRAALKAYETTNN